MTTYYVRKTGTDAADGTTPATAWLTIGKALGATGIASGDTVYIGPGVYREATITVNMTNPTAETFVIGDVLGTRTGDDPGEIRITNYLTNDTTAPTDNQLLNLNTRDYLTFQNIYFHAWYTGQIYAIGAAAVSQYITFYKCSFIVHGGSDVGDTPVLYPFGAANTPLHWEVDSCLFYLDGTAFPLIVEYASLVHTADFDVDFVFQNNMIQSGGFGGIRMGGGDPTVNGFLPGGMIIRNNYINSGGAGIELIPVSSVYKSKIYNNILIVGGFADGITSGTSINSNITALEDYNYLATLDGYELSGWITSGGHTVSNGSRAMLMHFGQETIEDQTWRPFGMPTAGSPLLGFGNDAGAPSVDILNRPRPAGGQSILNAVGPYERHDTAEDETTIYDSAPACQKIIGPGDQDYELPVLAEETVITIKVLYDDNHGATNKPQVQLLANESIGVTGETLTSDGLPNGWTELTFTTFTPTDRGVVVLRCISRSASASGIAYFDTISVNGA